MTANNSQARVKKAINWRTILTVSTIAALLLLVYFSREQIKETILNLRQVHLWALSLVLVWQIANYHTYAKLYQGLFGLLGKRMEYKSMYRAGVELTLVNHVFPSAGVSGFSYFSFRMMQYGATAAQATLVQTMRFITVFLSFQAILVFGVLALAVNGKASNLVIFVATSLGFALVFGTAIMVYIIGSKRRINAFFTQLTVGLNWLIKLVRPNKPETINVTSAKKTFDEFHDNYLLLKKNYRGLKWPLIWALLSSVTEILTLYAVYMAFGNYVNIGAVILAYAIANFAGLISVLPGGIGVYEGLMTAVLAAVGIPPSESLPVTVMYRILTMAIQLPIGYVFYHQAINSSKSKS
jgi:putative heme transporter